MIDQLLLLTGNDIPFNSAATLIHQPKIKEIALLGEEKFITGTQFLNFSKDSLSERDKIKLEKIHNFKILMTVLMKNRDAIKQVENILTLLFPFYQKKILPDRIMFYNKDNFSNFIISEENFDQFQEIIKQIFCLKRIFQETSYNVKTDKGRALVEKFRRRKEKLSKLKANKKESIFYKRILALAVGQHKDINSFLQYTVFQLFNQFEAFCKKENYDAYFSLKIAGAKDIENQNYWINNI